MNHERYERLKGVFHEAVEAEPARRAAVIHDLCAGDPELESEALLLLGQLDRAEGFLDSPAHTPPPSSAAGGIARAEHDPADLRFSSYSVKRTLGRGGMGVVYLAEQDHTRRTVALKVIRAGLATPGALQRFAFEAQVLGRLNHPGIAQIYDADTADTGHGPQPYFAMELVDGVSVSQHARDNHLDARARLALLAEVCDAVEYAHVKGVIHRDLKPGNILVDSSGHAKVLDFGVARATTPAADSSLAGLPSLNTQTGQWVGTLPYMSPEQIAGDPDDVDTRSDVYSLGVIGYELLADRPAFEVEKLPPLEGARIVQQTEPTPLSSISRVYKGDIETVIAAAMEKDRERRYQSAGALAADIRRYLSDKPIEARPASAWYQLAKCVRRNRVGVAAAICVCVVLITATLLSLWSAAHEREARKELLAQRDALRRRDAIARESRRLLEEIMIASSPSKLGRDARLVDVMEDAARRLEANPPSVPEVEFSLRHSIGYGLARLGHTDAGIRNLQRAMDLAGSVAEVDPAEYLSSERDLASALLDAGRYADAEVAYVRAIGRAEQQGNQEFKRLLRSDLGVLYLTAKRFAEAEPLVRERAEYLASTLGRAAPSTLTARSNLAALLMEQGDMTSAIQIAEEVVREERALYSGDRPEPLACLSVYQNLLLRLKGPSEAEPVAREIVSRCERAFGSEHPETLMAKNNRCGILRESGRSSEAEVGWRDVVADMRRVLGPSNRQTLNAIVSLATVLEDQARIEEAIETLRGAVQACDASPDGAEMHSVLRSVLAVRLLRNGSADAGCSEARQAIAESIALFGARDERTQRLAGRVCQALEDNGKEQVAKELRAGVGTE